jgi:hypothetical protein
MRQIVTALAEGGAKITTLTEYEEGWPYASRSRRPGPTWTLATVLAERGARSSTSPRRRSTRT